MPTLDAKLKLDRCPHCSVSKPNLAINHQFESTDYRKKNRRVWNIYICDNCGGVVTASAPNPKEEILEYYPTSKVVDEAVPERAKTFLKQALESIHAPSGAVMLTASAVDAMLKEKGYTDGKLYSRITKAAKDHVITSGMETWAHEVRLDANDQRHVDEGAGLPTEDDAQRAIDFSLALAEFMYVLPSKVQRGINPENGSN